MSTAEAAAGGHRDRSQSLPARAFAFLGHHGDIAIGLWMIGNGLSRTPSDQPDGWLMFEPSRRSTEPATTLFTTVSGVLVLLYTVAMLVILAAWIAHQGKLCERCITEFPLDAKATAVKYDRRLRLIHRPALWVLLLVLNVVAGIVFPKDTYWPMAVSVAFGGLWLYRGMAMVTHRRVQPWCPVCGGRGGGGESTPTPTPTPTLKVNA